MGVATEILEEPFGPAERPLHVDVPRCRVEGADRATGRWVG